MGSKWQTEPQSHSKPTTFASSHPSGMRQIPRGDHEAGPSAWVGGGALE
jgi:hypothetical protein